MNEEIEKLLKINIGKKIGISQGITKEDDDGELIDLIEMGYILSVHGNWISVETEIGIKYINMDRTDYFIFNPVDSIKSFKRESIEVKHDFNGVNGIEV